MSNYTKVTNFTAKDSLPSGNTGKVVRGSEIDTEFSNIQTAVNSKADTASPTFTGTVTIPTANISGGTITGITDLAIADGGTGASTAQAARNNLLPSQSTNAGKYLKTDGTDVSWDALDISTADITGTLPIANGGTGATSASAARTALGLAIGTDVQGYDPQLADIAGLTPTDNNFIVGNGTNFVTESGATARTSLGLGSIATQDASNVNITGGSVTGITDLAVADGGTGASDASGARTNLGLGSIATQAANNVSITGGSITGITDLAVADGGTGASTASAARINLLPSYTGNGSKVLALNSGATDVEWVTNGNGTVTSVDMTVPTGLAVSGNPVTSSGTLAVTYASGYSIPTNTKQTNWDTAYGWGDHSTQGYAKYADTTANFTGNLQKSGSNVLVASDIGTSVQAYDAQLADVAGLTPTDNGVIIGNGTNFVVESGATLKTSLGLTIGTDVQAYDSNLTSFVNAFTLPTTDGTNGQALTTNGSGTISWSTVAGAPGGSNTQLQYNNSGAFAGASGLTTDGTNLTLNGQADLRFADSDSSNWVAFQAPATISSNVTWTLPSADGTSGQVLSTNGSGTLSWATASGGGGGGGGTSTTTTQFTATSGQTTFTVSYTVGQISVYLNGALLAAADYTATNGTSVVLAAGAAAGDILTVVAYSSVTTVSQGDSKVEVTDSGSNGTIVFNTDNTERMRVTSAGNVGVGTTSPSAKFDVSSSSAGVTAGDFVVDTSNKIVYVGRQSSTNGDNSTFIVRNRVGTEVLKADASTQTVKTAATISVGGATASTSGAGITFPATQSASSDANTLDDYEEGTWTPVYEGTTGSIGSTAYSSTGTYTKIGNTVTVGMRLVLTNKGSWTGYVIIKGLPFTSANDNIQSMGALWTANVTFADQINARLGPNDTNIVGRINTSGAGGDYLLASAVSNNSEFYCSFTYRV